MSESDTAQTPEAVAYKLYRIITDKEFYADQSAARDRDYHLSTYAECLKATIGQYTSEEESTRPMVRMV